MSIFKYTEPNKKNIYDFCQNEMTKIDKEFRGCNLERKANYIINGKYTSEQKLILLATYVQKDANNKIGRKIVLNDAAVDYLFRGILDLIYHMPNNVPSGVYDYISSATDAMVDILNQLDKENEKAIEQGRLYRIND